MTRQTKARLAKVGLTVIFGLYIVAFGMLAADAFAAVVVARPVIIARPAPVVRAAPPARAVTPPPKAATEPARVAPVPIIVPSRPKCDKRNDTSCKD